MAGAPPALSIAVPSEAGSEPDAQQVLNADTFDLCNALSLTIRLRQNILFQQKPSLNDSLMKSCTPLRGAGLWRRPGELPAPPHLQAPVSC